ncbi:hypothetical protein UFOVP273_103 [uncultured Caudovirales phage]|uniref:Uncharacterized protein n=1 Tax=uncultured Caudovirales phage TaxID=2100421 RepID=A0A6J5LIT7_9CAUD|nr:hypothetical protein UFOVP273_103 [uncultured Caudovirales phage]
MPAPNEYQDKIITEINLLRNKLAQTMLVPVISPVLEPTLATMYMDANALVDALERLTVTLHQE